MARRESPLTHNEQRAELARQLEEPVEISLGMMPLAASDLAVIGSLLGYSTKTIKTLHAIHAAGGISASGPALVAEGTKIASAAGVKLSTMVKQVGQAATKLSKKVAAAGSTVSHERAVVKLAAERADEAALAAQRTKATQVARDKVLTPSRETVTKRDLRAAERAAEAAEEQRILKLQSKPGDPINNPKNVPYSDEKAGVTNRNVGDRRRGKEERLEAPRLDERGRRLPETGEHVSPEFHARRVPDKKQIDRKVSEIEQETQVLRGINKVLPLKEGTPIGSIPKHARADLHPEGPADRWISAQDAMKRIRQLEDTGGAVPEPVKGKWRQEELLKQRAKNEAELHKAETAPRTRGRAKPKTEIVPSRSSGYTKEVERDIELTQKDIAHAEAEAVRHAAADRAASGIVPKGTLPKNSIVSRILGAELTPKKRP